MGKISAVDSNLAPLHWGDVYRGYRSGASGPLNHAESVCRDLIETGAMSKVKARRIVEELDSSKPFLSRLEFIEALAALSATFPEDMNRKVTGANKRVAHILWCATDPDRAAWLFNNLRWRHSLGSRLRNIRKSKKSRLSATTLTSICCHLLVYDHWIQGRRALALLPSGTSSNEALHAEVKNWFSETQQMHQSTLRLKLLILTLGKQIPHFLAMSNPTISQCSSRILLARALANSPWTDATWQSWCSELSHEAEVSKARLPYNDLRKVEVSKTRKWNMKRPAAAKPKAQIKRTVFTLKRQSKLRTQGVRKCA